MKKLVLTLTAFTTLTLAGSAQTDPAPFNLNTGDLVFSAWSASSPAGSTPNNMAFHTSTDPTSATFDLTANGTGDWNCAFNLAARNRFLGLDDNGIGFLATSSPQFDDCTSGNASEDRYVGMVVIGLNTIGREQISIDWTGGTETVGDGTPTPRIMALRIQYRVGSSGSWQNTPSPVDYVTQTVGESQNFTTPLPVECENQPMVQVRWVYYQYTDGSGTRPELRLDEIEVTSSPLSSTAITELDRNGLMVWPNPSLSGIFQFSKAVSGVVMDQIGHTIMSVEGSTVADLSQLCNGVYVFRAKTGQTMLLVR